MLHHNLLPVVIAVLLPHVIGPEHFPPSLVGRHHPARLEDPPGTWLCHLDAIHTPRRRGNHQGAVVRPLTPGGCPLITAADPPAPGTLLLILAGDPGHALAAHARDLPPRIIYHILMRRINACSGSTMCPQFLSRRMTQKLIRIRQQMITECQQRQSENFSPT